MGNVLFVAAVVYGLIGYAVADSARTMEATAGLTITSEEFDTVVVTWPRLIGKTAAQVVVLQLQEED